MLYKLRDSINLGIFEKKLNHPMQFRNKFWLSAVARLFIFQEFMESISGEILHVESDVILSDDFPFKSFEKIQESFAYPVVFNERAVASTVYIKNASAAKELADFTKAEILKNSDTTDMIILRKFFNINSHNVLPLPFFLNFDDTYVRKLDDILKEKLNSNPLAGVGIFDGSDLGVYYFGTDPRNNRGKSRLRQEVLFSYLRMPNWELIFKGNRVFPYAKFGSQSIPIFSLHITCKDEKLFKVKTLGNALKENLLVQANDATLKIYPRIILTQAYKSLKRRIISLFKY
jgi:hypothetical protein